MLELDLRSSSVKIELTTDEIKTIMRALDISINYADISDRAADRSIRLQRMLAATLKNRKAPLTLKIGNYK